MESLLIQLAMAAMSQFGNGTGSPMHGGLGMPMALPTQPNVPIRYPQAPLPMAPRPDFPATDHRVESMQAATLAATTCLLRSGQIGRNQAVSMLDRQGESYGWRPGWGRMIPLHVVDRTIDASGGCRSLLTRVRRGRDLYGTGTQLAGERSRSEQEGFGLYPYR